MQWDNTKLVWSGTETFLVLYPPCVAVTFVEFEKWLTRDTYQYQPESVGLAPASSKISEKLSLKLVQGVLEDILAVANILLSERLSDRPKASAVMVVGQ